MRRRREQGDDKVTDDKLTLTTLSQPQETMTGIMGLGEKRTHETLSELQRGSPGGSRAGKPQSRVMESIVVVGGRCQWARGVKIRNNSL